MRIASVRIAINAWFLNQPNTGSGQYLRNLLRAIPSVASDITVLLVAPASHLGFEVRDLQVETWPLTSRMWQSNLGKVWFEQTAFPRICRQWGAELAHVPYWGSPRRPSVPTIVTVHDLIPIVLDDYRGGPLVRAYTRLVAQSARQATAIITDSQASKQDIKQHLNVPDERVHCIYLAADQQFNPTPSPDDRAVLEKYRLPERYVLYLAGHDVRKNVRSLVEAFAIVAHSDDEAALVIGGRLPQRDDPLFFDPRPLVESLDIQDRVHMLGWVDELHKPALYRGASCAVFASLYEGFGLPVLEALGCGTPLITSNTSSLPELVGDAGFAIEPTDVNELAGAILACLTDDALVAELRQRAPLQAARFSWTKTARETMHIFREVASCGS